MRTHLPQTKVRAKGLRQSMSLPEVLLWRALRKRPAGLKFRRQHPFGRYVLDFYCDATKPVLEVDGEAHNRGDQPRFDQQRDDWLRSRGLTVLRVPAKDVLANLEDVVRYITAFMMEAENPPPPGEGDHARHGGGGNTDP